MWIVNEKDSFQCPVSFKDESGAAVTPTSISYQILDAETGTTIRGATTVTPASSVTITLTFDDTTLVTSTRRQEERILQVTSVYGTDVAGKAIQKTDTYQFMVRRAGLTTIAKLKLFLGVDTTVETNDPLYLMLIDAAEEAIRGYLNRTLTQATYTEYFDGPGRPDLLLTHRPVQSITGIWVDPVGYYGQASGFGSSTALVAGVDFAVIRPEQSERSPGIVRMLSSLWDGSGIANWPRGQGNVKVTYVAGYNPVPLDVQVATHMLCAQMLSQQEKGVALKSETLGEYQYEVLSKADDQNIATARRMLNRYREVCV